MDQDPRIYILYPDPDPVLFVSAFKMSTKIFFCKFVLLINFEGTGSFISFFKGKKS
jgi:hypothetical protein